MRLQSLKLKRYLSIEAETVEVSDLNVLIGANASGKSNLLDALRFLHEAIDGDFEAPVQSRGGLIHLAWKGTRQGKSPRQPGSRTLSGPSNGR